MVKLIYGHLRSGTLWILMQDSVFCYVNIQSFPSSQTGVTYLLQWSANDTPSRPPPRDCTAVWYISNDGRNIDISNFEHGGDSVTNPPLHLVDTAAQAPSPTPGLCRTKRLQVVFVFFCNFLPPNDGNIVTRFHDIFSTYAQRCVKTGYIYSIPFTWGAFWIKCNSESSF